jgi:hypothetical protein
MKPVRNYMLAGTVFILIPVLQRCLDVIDRSIRLMMDRLDGFAFFLAAKLNADDSYQIRKRLMHMKRKSIL